MNFTVYQHINRINQKRYIGITRQNVARRWRPDGSGYKNNPYFWHAIEKYGWDNFDHIIVKTGLSQEDACKMERELIAKYQSNDLIHGYNIADGGQFNIMPLATRKRMSKERKGKYCGADNPNFGNHKLAGENNPNYGKHLSEEIRKKISDSKRGKKLAPFSEEHKRKMRENHRGGAEKKRVLCVEDGKIYDSINDASRNTGINKKGISGCCRNMPHYNMAGGYHWQFV